MRALALCLLLVAAPAAAQTSDPFPSPHNHSAALKVVRLEQALAGCPAAARGPKARDLWRGMLATFLPGQADVPAIKAWMRSEFAERRREAPPTGGWCERAKLLYGELGRVQPNAIVMRDGSDSAPKCVLDGSCSRANPESWLNWY